MDISGSPPAAPATLTLTGQLSRTLTGLQQGQQLLARVIRVDSPQRVLLELAGVRVQAQINQPLVPGQPLNLVVIRDGPTPALKIVHQDVAAATTTRTLRQVLPQQIPLADTLTALVQTAGQAATGSQLLPLHIIDMIKALLDRSLSRSDLSRAENLKMAVRDSGIFLEALLAAPTGHPGIPDDLKARLLRFRQQVGQALDGLSEQAPQRDGLLKLLTLSEAALARMTMHQIHSLASNRANDLAWHCEIPIQYQDRHDVIQLKFEQHRTRNHAPDPSALTTVTLRMNLTTLGQLEAVVTVLANKAQVTFRAEQDKAVDLLRKNIKSLSEDFSRHGLEAGQCLVVQSALGPLQKMVDTGLVDEQA